MATGAGSGAGAGGGAGAPPSGAQPPVCVTYFDAQQWSRRFPEAFFTASLPAYRRAPGGEHFEYQLSMNSGEHEWSVVRGEFPVCL